MTKEQILTALKREHSNLGLNEEVLSGVADSLLATGLITEENLDVVVKGQKSNLAIYQKEFDQKRTEISTLKSKIEEFEKAKVAGGTPDKKDEPKPDDLKAMIEAALEEKITPLQQKLQSYEQKEVYTARQTFISDEAKRLGIDPEDLEFLKIPDELDNAGITDRLTTYQQRQINRSLPSRTPFAQVTEDQCAKDEEKDFVASLPDAKNN
jgi:beta-glucosidase-like glycosyl hydrolase